MDVTRRSLLGQEGELSIAFFSWGAGGFFARIIREYRGLHPTIKLTILEMHTSTFRWNHLRMEGLMSALHGRWSRPYDRHSLNAELLVQRSGRRCNAERSSHGGWQIRTHRLALGRAVGDGGAAGLTRAF